MKEKTKLLFCIDTLANGGAEKVLIDFLKNIDYSFFDIDLFVIYNYGFYIKDIPENVNHIKDSQLLKLDYNIEIAFLEGMATKFIGFRKTTAKKIAWVHTDLFNLHWTKEYFNNDNEEKKCYSLFDKIVFVSNNALINFEKLFDIDTYKVVIYNLIDKEQIILRSSEIIINKRKFTICSVNSLKNHKRFDLLINAVNLLKLDNLDFELWILGDGVERKNLNQLIKKLKLENHILFYGFQQNPYPYMLAADIFAITSQAEGMSLVVCEALCLGKPIISTDTVGPLEILDNGRYGMLVEQNEKNIYQGLKRLVLDESLCESYKKNALKRSEIFDIEKTMNEFYNTIIK